MTYYFWFEVASSLRRSGGVWTIIQCLSYIHELACIGGSLFHFHASMNGIDDSWEWFHYQEVLYLSPNKTCISMLKTWIFNNAIDGCRFEI